MLSLKWLLVRLRKNDSFLNFVQIKPFKEQAKAMLDLYIYIYIPDSYRVKKSSAFWLSFLFNELVHFCFED